MEYFDEMDSYFKKIIERMFKEMAEFDESIKSGKIRDGWSFHPIEGPGVKGYVAQKQFRFGAGPIESQVPLRVPKEGLSDVREPLVDVFEDKDAVKLYVELPGIEKDDIQLNVSGGHAEIKAENFYKQIALPTRDIESEKTSANYKNGVLQVTIPKKTKLVSEKKKTIKID